MFSQLLVGACIRVISACKILYRAVADPCKRIAGVILLNSNVKRYSRDDSKSVQYVNPFMAEFLRKF